MVILESFRDILKKKRVKANLTQKELANKINITQSNYSGIENGYITPSLKVCSKLASILAIDMNILKNADFNKS